MNMLQVSLALDKDVVSPDVFSGFFLLGVKGIFLLSVLLYFVFSIVIIRQINVMKKTLITPFSPLIQFIGFGHLLIVGLIVLLFISVL